MLRSKIFFALIMVSVAAGQSGCASAPTEAEAASPPLNYKTIVRDYVRTSFFDPYSVRDAQIAAPKIGQLHIEGTMRHESGWTVCLLANAKNRMGAYTGLKPTLLLIKNDKVVATNSDADHYDVRTNCRDAPYEPFRELDEQAKRSGMR